MSTSGSTRHVGKKLMALVMLPVLPLASGCSTLSEFAEGLGAGIGAAMHGLANHSSMQPYSSNTQSASSFSNSGTSSGNSFSSTSDALRWWSYSGTARYVSDSTGREEWFPVAGTVQAGSRSEALRLSRENARSNLAYFGRVSSVDISSLW